MSSPPAPLAQPHRPAIMGPRHLIVAGHYLAAKAGFQVLEAGGNAVDATREPSGAGSGTTSPATTRGA